LALAAACFFSGCSAKYHREAADKEIYGSIQQTQKKLFNKTNEFSIKTKYSDRKPESIQPPELIEDRVVTNIYRLSVQEAIDLAVKNSREYQEAKEALYRASMTLAIEHYKWDPKLFASGGWQYNRDANGRESGTFNSSVGVTGKKLAATGGQIGLNLVNDLLRFYTGDPRQSAVSSLSINVVQPLLQGFGKNNDAVESLTQKERDLVYAVRIFSQFQESFALGILNDYFNMLALKDNVRNSYSSYQGKVDQAERMRARAVDRQNRTEVDQAIQTELSAKNTYINAVARFQTQLDTFKIRLGLPLTAKVYLDDSALEEIAKAGVIPVTLDAEAAYRLAIQRHLPTINAIDRFEDSQRQVRIAQDKLRANMTFVGSVSWATPQNNDWANFNAKEMSSSMGVQLDLPVDRKMQRFGYKSALMSFESAIRALTLVFDNVRNNIETGLRNLEQQRQTYNIQNLAVELAKARVASTTMNQQAGNVPVRDVIDAQDSLISAQNQLVLSLVSYQQARLRLMLDLGALRTDQDRFWLKDQLTDYLPASALSKASPDDKDQPVLPPDQFFNN
jgi:outer membrane protein TolC